MMNLETRTSERGPICSPWTSEDRHVMIEGESAIAEEEKSPGLSFLPRPRILPAPARGSAIRGHDGPDQWARGAWEGPWGKKVGEPGGAGCTPAVPGPAGSDSIQPESVLCLVSVLELSPPLTENTRRFRGVGSTLTLASSHEAFPMSLCAKSLL